MSSVLSFPIIRILVIVGLSVLFRLFLPAWMRNRIIPWSFALVIVHPNIVPFFSGGAHFLIMVVYWLNMAMLLNGFELKQMSRNRVLMAFLTFWGYYLLTSVRTDFPTYIFLYNINTLLELILIGYFAGMWAMQRPDGFRLLVRPLMIVAIIPILVYLKNGFGGEVSEGGRAMLNEELAEQELGTNVNAIALSLGPIVVLSLSYLLYGSRMKQHKVFYVLAGGSLFLSSYLLLRTGSRNGALVFLPCAWFFYKRMRYVRHKVLNMIVIAAAILGAAGLMYQKAGSLRSFTLKTREDIVGRHTLDDISSGRILLFQDLLAKSKGIDYVIGRGANMIVNSEGKKMALGALSAYVTLLSYSGVVGLLLLFWFYVLFLWIAFHKGPHGQIAILLFASWALTCVAEDAGINRGWLPGMMLGMAMALCTDQRYAWQEFDARLRGPRYGQLTWGYCAH